MLMKITSHHPLSYVSRVGIVMAVACTILLAACRTGENFGSTMPQEVAPNAIVDANNMPDPKEPVTSPTWKDIRDREAQLDPGWDSYRESLKGAQIQGWTGTILQIYHRRDKAGVQLITLKMDEPKDSADRSSDAHVVLIFINAIETHPWEVGQQVTINGEILDVGYEGIVSIADPKMTLATGPISITPGGPWPTMVPLDTLHPPLYPGAQNVKTENDQDVGDAKVTTAYQVVATAVDVLRHYDSFLIGRGWILVREDRREDGSISGRKYQQQTEFNGIPTILTGFISVTDFWYGPNKDKVFARFSVGRDPNPSRLPLYPGAQVLTTSEGIDDVFAWRRVVYRTNASLSDVESFYQANMYQLTVSIGGSNIREGLDYYRIVGGPEDMDAYILKVTATQTTDGQTEVTLFLQCS